MEDDDGRVPGGLDFTRHLPQASGRRPHIPKAADDSVRDFPFDRFPITKWAEDPKGLAGPRLYPRQKTLLKLMLPHEELTPYDEEVVEEWTQNFKRGSESIGVSPDIMHRREVLQQRGHPWFRYVLNISGRRGSKGLLGAIMFAYQAFRLCYMQNPQGYYGIAPGKELACFIFGTSEDQAKEALFFDVSEAIRFGPCFNEYRSSVDTTYKIALKTKADQTRQDILRKRGDRKEVASIVITARPTISRSGRGPAAWAMGFDEIAHVLSRTGSPQGAEELVGAAIPAMDQVREEAFAYMPSSPWQKLGVAWDIYGDGLRTRKGEPLSPEIMIIQLTSFDAYEDWQDPKATGGVTLNRPPSEYNEIMRSEERRDPAKFRVERRGQWAEVLDQYLYGPTVDRLFKPIPAFSKWPDDWYDRVDLSEDEGGFDPADVRTLAPSDGIVKWNYRAHLDPARSQHRCVLMIAHTEQWLHEIEDERGRLIMIPFDHVIQDGLWAWDPVNYPDHTLPYEEITYEIAQICMRYFTLKELTTDQYGFMLLPLLRQEIGRRMRRPPRIIEKDTTGPAKKRRWERAKTAMGLAWCHSFQGPRRRYVTATLTAKPVDSDVLVWPATDGLPWSQEGMDASGLLRTACRGLIIRRSLVRVQPAPLRSVRRRDGPILSELSPLGRSRHGREERGRESPRRTCSGHSQPALAPERLPPGRAFASHGRLDSPASGHHELKAGHG